MPIANDIPSKLFFFFGLRGWTPVKVPPQDPTNFGDSNSQQPFDCRSFLRNVFKMARTKRKYQKENPNAVEPSKKRVKTSDSPDNDTEPASIPKLPKFEGKKKINGNAPTKPLTKKQLLSDKSLFPEDQDRLVEAPLYELLGSEDSDERLQAADVIISKLLGSTDSDEGVSESSLDRHLEKRLFRGLASSRKASRLGFSVVLTEILQQLWGERNLCENRYRGLTFDFVLNTLMERTKPVGNVAGQEEKDHYFGQLFGIECFVRARVLFDDVARWHTILDLLLRLARKKVWLKAQCAWVIVQAVPQMDQGIAEATLQKTDEAGWAKSPEAVALTVVFTERFPSIKMPSKSWRDFLSTKYLGELPAVLKDSGKQEPSNGQDSAAQKQKQGNWSAQLHFVWDIILAHYVKLAGTDKDASENQFKQFWTRVVDQGFFSKTASEPQKFTGFMIFQKFLEGGLAHPSIVQNLFSQNLTTSLMNQAAKQDRYLHRAATKALKTIERAIEVKPDVVPIVLAFLLGKHGVYNFDQKTNSKTVDKVLHATQPEHAGEVIKNLRRLVLATDEYVFHSPTSRQCANVISRENPENRVLVYAEYLSKLAAIPPQESEDKKAAAKTSAAGLALQEFSKLAYPKTGEAHAGFTDKTKPILRQKLNAALGRFVKRPEDFGEFCGAIASIDSSSVEMDDELQAELLEALEKLQELTSAPKSKKSSKKEDKTSGAYEGLALLYAVAILLMYNEEPDAVEILGDLKQCYEKLSGGEEEVSVLLVEVLLALVARPSSLMRTTAERVFETFTRLVTAEALELLTDTLAAAENAEGLRALFDTDADMEDAGEMGEEDDDEEGSGLDSDVELVDLDIAENGGEEASGGEEDENEDEDDDSGSDGDDDDNDDVPDQYKALDEDLAKLLNTHRLDRDADAASSSGSDSDMSDSEMMALDEKLSAAFKMRMREQGGGVNKKKQNRDAAKTVVNFKHRALDLLGIFVRKEAGQGNSLAYAVLVPLLQLMRTSKTRDLGKKAGAVIAEMRKKVGATSSEEVDVEALQSILEEIHEEMPKDDSHAFAKAASAASLVVVQGMLARDVGVFPAVWDAYGKLAVRWAAGGGSGWQFSAVLADWMNWVQTHPGLVAEKIDQEAAEENGEEGEKSEGEDSEAEDEDE